MLISIRERDLSDVVTGRDVSVNMREDCIEEWKRKGPSDGAGC